MSKLTTNFKTTSIFWLCFLSRLSKFRAWIKFLGPHYTSGDSYTGYGGIIEMGNGNWTSSSHFMFYVMREVSYFSVFFIQQWYLILVKLPII